MNRRAFLKKSLLATGILASSQIPLLSWAKSREKRLSILHTNDVHSRIDPFPMDGGRFQGLGGVLARERVINELRTKDPGLLLFDAGDIFQGTPYFNFFKGKLELKLMSRLGYDAATLGNHDFDNGIELLADMMSHANFPFINCNYNFNNTPLADKIEPYTIFNRNGIRVGVLGVGIELQGLVEKRLFGNTIYNDPIEPVNKISKFLKETKKCDYVVCLSHLGYRYKGNKISDLMLAKKTSNIDLIIGGHTHTFLEQAVQKKNKNGEPVLINQVGWAGINLGVINIKFSNNKLKKYASSLPVKISKQTTV